MRATPGLIAALLLLAAPAALAPALAQDNGYGYSFQGGGVDDGPGFLPTQAYAGLRGSMAFSGTTSATIPTSPPTALRASYNTGGGASIFIGTHLPYGFKLELEGVYRYLPFDVARLNGAATVTHGQAQIAAPMVNLFWDLPLGVGSIQPFIGGGIGAAYMYNSMRDTTDTNVYMTTNKWGLAYDAMGGLTVPITPAAHLTAMYRWMQLSDFGSRCGTSGAPTLTCSADLTNQSIDLGLELEL